MGEDVKQGCHCTDMALSTLHIECQSSIMLSLYQALNQGGIVLFVPRCTNSFFCFVFSRG